MTPQHIATTKCKAERMYADLLSKDHIRTFERRGNRPDISRDFTFGKAGLSTAICASETEGLGTVMRSISPRPATRVIGSDPASPVSKAIGYLGPRSAIDSPLL